METLTRVWALALAHPMYSVPLALVALVLLASAINRALPPGPPKTFVARLIDRLAVLVRRGAVNGPWSWPLLGYSLFEAVRDSAREAWPAEDKPRGEGGFVAGPVLRAIATVVILVVGPLLSLPGCPMPAPDGCTPRDTRCSPAGIPEVCSATQRWSHAPPGSSCADRGPVVCCLARSPWGREVHACVPASECLAADGGAL